MAEDETAQARNPLHHETALVDEGVPVPKVWRILCAYLGCIEMVSALLTLIKAHNRRLNLSNLAFGFWVTEIISLILHSIFVIILSVKFDTRKWRPWTFAYFLMTLFLFGGYWYLLHVWVATYFDADTITLTVSVVSACSPGGAILWINRTLFNHERRTRQTIVYINV